MDEIVLERHETTVSFPIRLIDDYSGDSPIGNVNVSLKDRKEKPIRNPSLFYVFVDIPGGTYTVHVGSDFYMDEDLSITTDGNVFDLEEPFEIKLKPNFSYPFPNGATIIRGTICTSSGQIMSDTDVTIIIKGVNGDILDMDTKTSEYGEFMLYFTDSNVNEFITKNKPNKYLNIEIKKNEQIIMEKEIMIGETSIIRCKDFS